MTENFKTLFSKERATSVLRNNFRNNGNSNKQNTIKVQSHYGKKLKESKKISQFYGNLEKRELQKIFRKCCNKPSKINENMFRFLESRLDVVLYRAGFFESIASAKQMVRIGGIKVNKKKVVSPSYIVTPGDIVSVFEKKDKKTLLKGLQFKQYFPFISQNNEIKMSSIIGTSKSIEDSDKNTVFNKTRFLQNFIFPSKEIVLSLNSKEENNEERLTVKKKIELERTQPFAKSNRIHNSVFKKEIRWRFKISSLFMAMIAQNKSGSLIHTIKKTLQLKRFKEDKTSKPFRFLSLLSSFNQNPLLESQSKNDKFSFLSPFEKEKFALLNYLLYLKKNLQKKSNSFKSLQESKKDNTFFRHQKLSNFKKSKANHLEISYKSLSIVFLFTPQQICFPYFINFSLIYK